MEYPSVVTVHVPPPALHACLSASRAQENGAVTGLTPSLSPVGGVAGGSQIADVKPSTIFRTKNLGKVPPKFETLTKFVSHSVLVTYLAHDLRRKEGHVSATNDRIGDFGVEG